MFCAALSASLVLAAAAAAAEEERGPVDVRQAQAEDEFAAPALLPADSVVQNRSMWRTLEYTPHKLNVVVGGAGEIVAIGCF